MLAKIPFALKKLFPKRIWSHQTSEKVLYFTFDDGPIPEITPWILEQLKMYAAKASFFCIGDNIRKNPKVFRKVVAADHSIGNHTYNHLNGWKTSTQDYLDNVLKAETLITKGIARNDKNKLFRPPYGRLTGSQARRLIAEDYKIIMWEVLSMDYDQSLSGEKCYHNVIRNARPGSIIVFHDSLKAEKNLKEVLPRVLEYYSGKGFKFKGLQ